METDILITMQEDLRRALAKPAEQRRWAMVIDLRKCVGCHACTLGCATENQLPPKLWYRPVLEAESGKYPKVVRSFLPRPCMQCDQPACVAACPQKGPGGATWKETKGIAAGTVPIDYAKCVGCGACVKGCPYGARTVDAGAFHAAGTPAALPYEAKPAFEYGAAWPRVAGAPPIGKARKCHFCVHRLAAGQLPACVSTCLGRASYFGDESDPQSLVAQVKKANPVQLLKPRAGTAPRVSYVADVKVEVIHG
jgi:molybdopterin-containing oxidoreductase family iron-sulfur binding subunit